MPRKRSPARDKQRNQGEIKANSHLPNQAADGERHWGRVVSRYGAGLDVEDEHGVVRRCKSRRKFSAIVCGDQVIWQPAINNEGVVIELLERKTLLARPDDIGRDKPIAANIDQIIIIVTAVPRAGDDYYLFHNLIDRYIVAAEHMSIRPVIVINKFDLLNEEQRQHLEDDTAIYRDLGYAVINTSTKIERGMDALLAQLSTGTSVFVGESGVGKSSIIQQLLPAEAIKVGEVSSHSGKGKHTTTTARLYHLTQGGLLIDSPGVREFGLGKLSQPDLAWGFVEFRDLIHLCRFNNCRHMVEPSCAVIAAVESGEIHARRYQHYQELVEDEVAAEQLPF